MLPLNPLPIKPLAVGTLPCPAQWAAALQSLRGRCQALAQVWHVPVTQTLLLHVHPGRSRLADLDKHDKRDKHDDDSCNEWHTSVAAYVDIWHVG